MSHAHKQGVFAVGRDGPDQLNNRAPHRSQNGGRKFGPLGDVGDDDKLHSSSLVLIGDLSAGRGSGWGNGMCKAGFKNKVFIWDVGSVAVECLCSLIHTTQDVTSESGTRL